MQVHALLFLAVCRTGILFFFSNLKREKLHLQITLTVLIRNLTQAES